MSNTERYDAVVIGSGEGGKYLAWHLAQAGEKTTVQAAPCERPDIEKHLPVVQIRTDGGDCTLAIFLASNVAKSISRQVLLVDKDMQRMASLEGVEATGPPALIIGTRSARGRWWWPQCAARCSLRVRNEGS